MLNKHGMYFLKLYQQRSYVLALEDGPQVEGMYLAAEENGISLRNAGKLLLVGGGGHRTGKKGAGWQPAEEFARKYAPHARQICRWATQDCMSLVDLPYIGPYSKSTPDLFVATGFNKWGMTNSMVAAMVLEDLVKGKENSYAPMFSPSRSMLRPQLACNGVETAVNLLTPTAPRCPHMGCSLKWNPLEHSWDCACHGSRFDKDGKLLDNPATGDLKKTK
jgi:glycine/D-amino acid oxidase-like deaminating enzyme